MIVDLDTSSPVPPFEQVRSGLASRINDHSLAVGTRLPTVRKLAADLGLAANTVARAYRELEVAGLIETRGRTGSFVSAAGDKTRQRLHDAAADYADLAHRLGVPHAEAIEIVAAVVNRTLTSSVAVALAQVRLYALKVRKVGYSSPMAHSAKMARASSNRSPSNRVSLANSSATSCSTQS